MEMEVWDIYDEDGNYTGRTMERNSDIVRQKGIYHPCVDVWIINSDNKILIQRRSPQKKFRPNIWAMTGGSIQHGESPIEALKREVLEELQVELDVNKTKKIKRYKTDNIWLDVYVAEQDIDLDKVVLQIEEVSEVKFATYDEIEKLFKNNEFIDERWEYVREEIADFIKERIHADER